MTTENEKAAEKPAFDYIAYAVEKNGKGRLTGPGSGVGWFHKKGEGFTVKLSALPLNGEIVFRKPRPADQQAEQGEPAETTEGEGVNAFLFQGGAAETRRRFSSFLMRCRGKSFSKTILRTKQEHFERPVLELDSYAGPQGPATNGGCFE